MQQRIHKSQEILLPANGVFIIFTLLAGFTFNLLPWHGLLLLIRPDFVALILVYWAINQPHRIGLGTAWFFGLLMDVADGSLFGQHALAYTIITYGALFLHRRVLMFPLWPQAFHIFPILLLLQLLLLLIQVFVGIPFMEWGYFLPSVTGTLLWPPLSLLLLLPQRRTPKPENTTPAQAVR